MSDRNTKLMKEMGSKTGRYDPEPPAQWQWQLENGTPAERFLAWVKSKTVAFGHVTPYATDEHGKELYIEHAAADLGWAFHTTQNVATALVEQGRIRLDRKGKRIWLCAEVAAKKADDGRNLGEVDENLSSVQRIFPTYVIDFIENLPKHEKDAAIRKYSEYWKWHLGLLSNAVAAARAISAPYEDITLREIGMDKKRLPQRREPAPVAVQLQLLEVPSFVQNNGHGDLYKGENGSVHHENAVRTNGASLLTSDADNYTDKEGGGKLRTKPPSPSPQRSGNGNSTAVAVVPAPDPETVQRFEQWRTVRNRCKKPVPDSSHELQKACFQAFAAYPPAEQEQIIADTAARIDSWNAENKLNFIPGPLEYFSQKKWRTEPVQYVAVMSNADRQRRDHDNRMMAWAEEMDRRDGRKR